MDIRVLAPHRLSSRSHRAHQLVPCAADFHGLFHVPHPSHRPLVFRFVGVFSLARLLPLISCLKSTVQFVGISAFHTRVSDPLIGGTYMTVRHYHIIDSLILVVLVLIMLW